MKVISILALSTIFFLGALTICDAEVKPAGIVKSLENSASIKRKEEVLTAENGMSIWMGDEIRTGPAGSIGIIFIDDTVLSPDKRALVREVLTWYKENHPIWFRWLELA